MKTKLTEITILVLLLTIASLCFAAWDNDKPGDNQTWNSSMGSIRDNMDALEVELGIDLAEAHPYFQSAAPSTKPDGSTALDVDDNGRIWVDSDDNLIYVLTDYSGPTWTSAAASGDISETDATFTLTNTDEEDSAGGRQSRWISKGEQSGGEATTLGYIEFSHDSTGDDEKGKVAIKLNDGDDTNSPSKQAIGYLSTGKIDVSSSLSVLDENDFASDDDEVVATQQSIKAYIATQIATIGYGAYTTEDDDTNTMIKAHAYLANQDGTVTAYTTSGSAGESLAGYIGSTTDPAGAGDKVTEDGMGGTNYPASVTFPVASGKYFELTGAPAITIYWHPKGTLVKPTDQD